MSLSISWSKTMSVHLRQGQKMTAVIGNAWVSDCVIWQYCHVYVCDYRWGLDWWLNLLTTYTLTIRDYTLQITDTHRLVAAIYHGLH
jgi:hypothetical protein